MSKQTKQTCASTVCNVCNNYWEACMLGKHVSTDHCLVLESHAISNCRTVIACVDVTKYLRSKMRNSRIVMHHTVNVDTADVNDTCDKSRWCLSAIMTWCAEHCNGAKVKKLC